MCVCLEVLVIKPADLTIELDFKTLSRNISNDFIFNFDLFVSQGFFFSYDVISGYPLSLVPLNVIHSFGLRQLCLNAPDLSTKWNRAGPERRNESPEIAK